MRPMLLASLTVFVFGWVGLWVVARHEAKHAFATWLRNERAQGRAWTCPEERIGGFPLGIVVSCREPTFRGPLGDGIYEGTLDAFSADARLYFPTHVTVMLDGPLTLQDAKGGGPSARIDWSAAQLNLRGEVPGDLDRGQIELSDVVAVLPGQSMVAPLHIGQVEASFRPVLQKAMQPFDVEAALTLTDARIPEADAAFGSPSPLSAKLTATVTRFTADGTALPQLLEPWRDAGGQLRVKSFSFQKGAFRAEGEGRIELDDERRIEGRLDARFSGLEPVAKRFGIPTGAVQIGSALSNLFGSKGGNTDLNATDLALPLVAKDGHLWIGPVKIGVTLKPIY